MKSGTGPKTWLKKHEAKLRGEARSRQRRFIASGERLRHPKAELLSEPWVAASFGKFAARLKSGAKVLAEEVRARQPLNQEHGIRGLGLVRWGSSSLSPCSGDGVFGSLGRIVICQARFVPPSGPDLFFSRSAFRMKTGHSSIEKLSEVKVPVICSLNTAINIAITLIKGSERLHSEPGEGCSRGVVGVNAFHEKAGRGTCLTIWRLLSCLGLSLE